MAIPVRKADVLVIGGGMSGLCAAVAALEQGAQVLLIEKGSRFGGSMALSNGTIWSFADFATLKRHVPEGDATLQETLVEQLTEATEWLTGAGVQLEPEFRFLQYGRARRCAPAQLTAALLDRIAALGGSVVAEVALQDLLLRDGRVRGALAFNAEGPLEIEARRVVIATGGFQGNPELVARYITPLADSLYLRSNPWSTGDGLQAALTAGAATTPLLHAFYGHAMSAPPARFNRHEFQAMSHKYGQMAVALDLNGQRFADESAGTGEELLNARVASLPGCRAVYVFDAAVGSRPLEGSPLANVVADRARQAGAPVAYADTLAQLAQAMEAWGLPAAVSLRSLREYNEAILSAGADSLVPARRAHRHAVAQPPFTATLVQASISFTCGGLFVDPDMRVLRRAASVSSLSLVTADVSELQVNPIPQLYAAGCDVGGFNGRGYVGGLAQALVTGRIAGAAAARGA